MNCKSNSTNFLGGKYMTCKNKSIITKRKAFTLIELLIVIAIIGILFIVLVSKVDFATDKAKATGVQTDFRSFQLALETVSRENAGFNTFGWDTGDTNANGKRDSYDEGDTNKDGIQNGTEVFTGRKVYAETFTKVYSLVKPGATGYDREALNKLETAINANLDPKLHITIKDDGEIVMANGAKDPWNKEYHGWYITNAEVDKKDRGAIVIYSDGANNEFGSEHKISNGVVVISIPGSNKAGKDDYGMVVVYTYVNGYGEIKTSTSGFEKNKINTDVGSNNGGNSDETPVIDTLAAGLYDINGNIIAPWQLLIDNYGMDIYTNYSYDSTVSTKPNIVIEQNFPNAYKLVIEGTGRIGDYAFSGTTLNEIVVKEGITEFGDGAFNGTSHLLKFELPSTVKKIGMYCFNNTNNLNSVVFKEGLEEIGAYAFCITSLVDVELPLSCKTIGEKAFHSTPSLISVKGNGVETIDQYAFAYLSNLTFAEFHNLKEIKEGAFAGTKLTSFTLPDGLRSIGNYVFQYTYITEFNIPNTVTTIGKGAFEGTPVEFLYIPDSVVDMQSPTYWSGYSLKAISLPNSNFETHGSVIVGETNVECVIIRNNKNVLNVTMFNTSAVKNWIIYVPDTLVDAYKNDAGYIQWQANIRPLSECPPQYIK